MLNAIFLLLLLLGCWLLYVTAAALHKSTIERFRVLERDLREIELLSGDLPQRQPYCSDAESDCYARLDRIHIRVGRAIGNMPVPPEYSPGEGGALGTSSRPEDAGHANR